MGDDDGDIKVSPSDLGIEDDEEVLFISDPFNGDVFIVLSKFQTCQQVAVSEIFGDVKLGLDWDCYDEEPRVIYL